MSRWGRACVHAFLTLGAPGAALADCEVIYVAKGHTNAVNDGSSWPNAFWEADSLQQALDAAEARLAEPAAPDCIDVWIAGGVYLPPASPGTFRLIDKVSLYGGFAVGDVFADRSFGCAGGENGGRPCASNDDCPGGACDVARAAILSGDFGGDDGAPCTNDADCGGWRCAGVCLAGVNSASILTYDTADAAVILDGLVVRYGKGSEGSGLRIGNSEDGCLAGGPTIRNCLFSNNYNSIGGTVSDSGLGTSYDNCVFRDNVAQERGGAITIEFGTPSITGSLFERNSVVANFSRAGAIAIEAHPASPCFVPDGPLLDRCRFHNNAVVGRQGDGGAISSRRRIEINGSYFIENQADDSAGAISAGGSLVITGCDFSRNRAGRHAGAISSHSSLMILDSRLYDNHAWSIGGALLYEPFEEGDSLLVEDSQFIGNSASIGGAATVISFAASQWRRTMFAGNIVTGADLSPDGSAVYEESLGGSHYEDCQFIGNGPAPGVLALSQLQSGASSVANCLFAGNRAPAIGLLYDASINLTNSTLAFNTGAFPFGGGTHFVPSVGVRRAELHNTILWGNGDDQVLECHDQIQCRQTCSCADCSAASPCFTCQTGATVTVENSDIQHPSCVWPGVGNINEDPRFVRNDVPRDCDGDGWGDPQCVGGPCPIVGPAGCDDYGDFRLREDSPCVGAGFNGAPDLPDRDLDGLCRIAGNPPIVDMGAYEFRFAGGECCLDEECGEGLFCCKNRCEPDVDSDADTVADCLDRCPGEDDTIDADDNGLPDCAQFFAIPTVSAWGLLILAMVVMVIAKIGFGRSAGFPPGGRIDVASDFSHC